MPPLAGVEACRIVFLPAQAGDAASHVPPVSYPYNLATIEPANSSKKCGLVAFTILVRLARGSS